jgi:hypothetical protein
MGALPLKGLASNISKKYDGMNNMARVAIIEMRKF